MIWKWIKDDTLKENRLCCFIGKGYHYDFKVSIFENPLDDKIYSNLFMTTDDGESLYKSYSSIRKAMSDAFWLDVGYTREDVKKNNYD